MTSVSQIERIGLIAGNGSLPLMVAETLEMQGQSPFVVGIEGEADPLLTRYDYVTAYSGHPGKVVAALKSAKVTDVVMVGGVRGRPKLTRLRPDWTTLKFARKMIPNLGKGDDALLRGVIDILNEAGMRVRGVHEIVPDLLAPEGQLAGSALDRQDIRALRTAVKGATTLGALDAGQAVVAIGNRLVALEGAEGTDMMLERVSRLRAVGRLADKKTGVLLKLAKPGQELRADLPTIGPDTVRGADAAKLKAVAIHAGRGLIVELEETCRLANEANISLVGVEPDELPR